MTNHRNRRIVTIERSIDGIRCRVRVDRAYRDAATALLDAASSASVDNAAAVAILDPIVNTPEKCRERLRFPWTCDAAGRLNLSGLLQHSLNRLRVALHYLPGAWVRMADDLDAEDMAHDPRAEQIEIDAYQYFGQSGLTHATLKHALLDYARGADDGLQEHHRPVWILPRPESYIPADVLDEDFGGYIEWEHEESWAGPNVVEFARRVLGNQSAGR